MPAVFLLPSRFAGINEAAFCVYVDRLLGVCDDVIVHRIHFNIVVVHAIHLSLRPVQATFDPRGFHTFIRRSRCFSSSTMQCVFLSASSRVLQYDPQSPAIFFAGILTMRRCVKLVFT
jgi:hypothetical protein